MPGRLFCVHFLSKIHLLVLLIISYASTTAAQISTSTKRGLIDISTSATIDQDISTLTSGSSDLTWYYNYGSVPSSELSSTKLEFVPMLWGATESNHGNGFLDSVRQQISFGANITAVLGFNEPDGCSNGGSCVPADLAASTWMSQIEPLRGMGVKLGSPATTGALSGLTWLANWFAACNGGCNPDFIAVHWYGGFEGFASWIGQVSATYPNISEIWVTEYALPNANLSQNQAFYNQSSALLDRWDAVGRYSYFGSFRSSVSNIGPDVAMLDQSGQLTDIGAWYLGRSATGNVPQASTARTMQTHLLACFALLTFICLMV